MSIVASGNQYTDIDSYACAIAYAELQRLLGHDTQAVLPGALNVTIPPLVKNWQADFQPTIPASVNSIQVVDISDPQIIGSWLDVSKVTELFDHHYGHEDYWRQKLGNHSHIEAVGACATLIWEQWQAQNQGSLISQTSARLLLTAIISNTLNFNASVTTTRDHQAATDLSPIARLPSDFVAYYYQQIESSLVADPTPPLQTDIKVVELPSLGLRVAISQIELWHSQRFVKNHQPTIKSTLSAFSDHWLLTSPSISQGINYFYTESRKVQQVLRNTTGAKFTGNIGITNKLFLRKEILRDWQKLTALPKF